jgi:PIN domain nuclease of toxin-antitoxin system
MIKAALLDTMALLWMGLRPDLLGAKARETIGSEIVLSYSMVSLWEIGIKMSGKGYRDFQLPADWETVIPQRLVAQGIDRVEILPKHCRMIQDLPFHHRDPFDRLLIAQALEKKLAVITPDEVFEAYGVKRVW